MVRKAFSRILIIVIVVMGLAGVVALRERAVGLGAIEAQQPTSSTAISSLAPYFSFSSSTVKEETANYSLTFSYPTINGFSETENNEVNNALSTFVSSTLGQYKKDFSGAEDVPSASEKSFLEGDFQVTLLSPQWVSVAFSTDSYLKGAAHPNSGFVVFNYHLSDHRVISLADMFKTNSDYPARLSSSSIASIIEQRRQYTEVGNTPEDLEDVLGPKTENFSNFTLQSDGLHLYFDQCSVRACAEGTYEVVVPKEKIQDILQMTW